MDALLRSEYFSELSEPHHPLWMTVFLSVITILAFLTVLALLWILYRNRDSLYTWLYNVRWNTFGSIPPIDLHLEEDQHLILGRPGHYHLSLSDLVSKAERSASPPPYDDPPPYDLAVEIWGAPCIVISEPVTV